MRVVEIGFARLGPGESRFMDSEESPLFKTTATDIVLTAADPESTDSRAYLAISAIVCDAEGKQIPVLLHVKREQLQAGLAAL